MPVPSALHGWRGTGEGELPLRDGGVRGGICLEQQSSAGAQARREAGKKSEEVS